MSEMLKNNRSKIGMNSPANKMNPSNKPINIDDLNKTFVHCKKLMKSKYLAYGNPKTRNNIMISLIW